MIKKKKEGGKVTRIKEGGARERKGRIGEERRERLREGSKEKEGAAARPVCKGSAS